MRKIAVTVTLASALALTGCQDNEVNPAPTSGTGSASTSSSTSTSSGVAPTSTSSTSSSGSSSAAPAVGSKVPGATLAQQIHAALTDAKTVKYYSGNLGSAQSSSPTSNSLTDTVQLKLDDPMTAAFTDGGSSKRDVIAVDGVVYGYDRRSKNWVKQSQTPSPLEQQFVATYTSQIAELDPRVAADMLSAGEAVVKGQTTIGGVQATHYAVTATGAALMDKQVASMKAHGCDLLAVPEIKKSFDKAKAKDGATQYTLEVFLDPQNRPLVYLEPTKGGGSKSGRDYAKYTGYGDELSIEAPSSWKTFAEVEKLSPTASARTSSSSS